MKRKQRGETILVILLIMIAIGGWFTKEHDRLCTDHPTDNRCEQVG